MGIPFGAYHLPPASFGDFTGVLRGMQPQTILAELEAARWASARVLISFIGHEGSVVGPDGHFSIAKWKAKVDQYRGVDFSSYVADGTVFAHYLMDEPNDKSNWGGEAVKLSDIDEMARYSKEIWPTLQTVIRGWPHFLKGYQYQYLDAAWAQYHNRFGDIKPWIAGHVQTAKDAGLGMIVGMNLLAGGGEEGIPGVYRPHMYAMNASQLRAWGGTLLAEPYICAFIGWKFDAGYFARPDIKAALKELRDKAAALPKKTCRL